MLAIPPRMIAACCRLFGCAQEDLQDELAALPYTDSDDLLHPSGAVVRLVVALPFRDGIAFRVASITPAPSPAEMERHTSPARVLSDWLPAGMSYRLIT
jgi:hypothetical protein